MMNCPNNINQQAAPGQMNTVVRWTVPTPVDPSDVSSSNQLYPGITSFITDVIVLQKCFSVIKAEKQVLEIKSLKCYRFPSSTDPFRCCMKCDIQISKTLLAQAFFLVVVITDVCRIQC